MPFELEKKCNSFHSKRNILWHFLYHEQYVKWTSRFHIVRCGIFETKTQYYQIFHVHVYAIKIMWNGTIDVFVLQQINFMGGLSMIYWRIISRRHYSKPESTCQLDSRRKHAATESMFQCFYIIFNVLFQQSNYRQIWNSKTCGGLSLTGYSILQTAGLNRIASANILQCPSCQYDSRFYYVVMIIWYLF